MTDTNTLAPCPHCGAPASGYAIEAHKHSGPLKTLVPDLPDHPGSYVIEGDCACGSGMIGDTQAEVTERWNRRAPTPAIQPVAVPAIEAEQFIQAAIDSAPNQFRRLGEFLARTLDEDQWAPAQSLLLGGLVAVQEGRDIQGDINHYNENMG